MSDRWAFISVYDKTDLVPFAQELQQYGFKLLSSGGTASVLMGAELEVKTVAELSGLNPILSHRVVTLVPQVHGGLLALPTAEHQRELQMIGGVPIQVAVVDFYPLAKEIERPGATLESIRNQIDIGGPTAVMSAVKGARYPICRLDQRQSFLEWLEDGEPDPELFALQLQAIAANTVAQYYHGLAVYLQTHIEDLVSGR